MFTGLVETVGTVISLKKGEGGAVLAIRAPMYDGELSPGQSVAVGGACLTVISFSGEIFSVDVMPETLKKSVIGNLRPGSGVNLERALRADGRLDGHFVTGHIDGVATVREIKTGSDGYLMTLALDGETASLVVPRGSLAVDGVSLTIASASEDYCVLGLIPSTLRATTLGWLRPGDRVNVEADILGKYVKKFLSGGALKSSNNGVPSLTREFLTDAGWL
ncbi:MAG: riboflavin synthase [Synergistaceae bacterium]|nr:riboflavin synthase [Synergistaceae bacterium]